MKVGDFVLVYYWDHASSRVAEPSKPIKCKSPGWIVEMNHERPAHIIIAHDYAYYPDDEERLVFPFSTILKSDIIRIVKLPESK